MGGWDLGRLKTFHDNQATTTSLYPSSLTHQQQWTVPDIFTMILDMDRGSLGFAVGDEFLGWTHHGLGPVRGQAEVPWRPHQPVSPGRGQDRHQGPAGPGQGGAGDEGGRSDVADLTEELH